MTTVREPSREATRSADVVFTCVLALVALLPRLFVALAWAREPVWDGHYYHFGALRIAEGLGYSEDIVVNGIKVWRPWCHYPVGYSAMLAAAYKVFGTSLVVAPLVNAVVGTLLVVVVHRLGLRSATVNRARIAAGITAVHPGLIAYSALLMNELVCAFLVLAAAWVAVRRLRWSSLVVSGVLFGLSTLVRPSSILAAPLVALVMPLPRLTALSRAAVVSIIAVATVLPWSYRNCRTMDGCAFVSTNGGWNFAIGALTPTGRFQPLHASDGCPVVTGQVQQDRCWAEVGRAAVLRDPIRWVRLIPEKLSQTYDHESFAIEYLREADPQAWPEGRRVAGRALFSAFHQILLVAAALGLVSLPSPRRVGRAGMICQGGLLAAILACAGYAFVSDSHVFWLLPALVPVLGFVRLPGAPPISTVERFLLGWIFATTLTHAVFFGEDRYHLVVTPALAMLAASALRRLPVRSAMPSKVAA